MFFLNYSLTPPHFPFFLSSSSISTKVTCGTYGLQCDGELREGGSESELSCQPTTEFPGRSLQQVKIASPSSLSRSESSPSFGNIVRGGSSSLKMKEMAPMNPPSEALSGKTSYNHDIATAMVHPSSLNTSSHPLFTSGGGGVHAFLDSKFIPPLKKRSESFHARGAGNLDCEIFEPKNHLSFIMLEYILVLCVLLKLKGHPHQTRIATHSICFLLSLNPNPSSLIISDTTVVQQHYVSPTVLMECPPPYFYISTVYQYKKKELQAPWDLDSSSSQSK